MTKDQRKALLERVGAGLTVASGAAELRIPMAEVHRAGKRFGKQLDEAFSKGNARLEAWLLTELRSEKDTKAVAALLERREQVAAASTHIEAIERRIIFKCEKCGHKPEVSPAGGGSRALHSPRPTGKPGNGADA